MADTTGKSKSIFRAIQLTICAVIFLGALLYSSIKLKYQVGDQVMSQRAITELSLSHNIKRDDSAMLALRPGSLDRTGSRRPCPT